MPVAHHQARGDRHSDNAFYHRGKGEGKNQGAADATGEDGPAFIGTGLARLKANPAG